MRHSIFLSQGRGASHPRLPVIALITALLGSGSISSLALGQESTHRALLVSPRELTSGSPASATVTVVDASGNLAPEVPVYLELLRNGESVGLLARGNTGADGHLFLPYELPDVENGTYEIRAIVAGVSDPLVSETTVSSTPAILLETDKPIYKPGQKILGRVVLLDSDLRPRTGDVELTFFDARNIRIDRQHLTASSHGVAAFELQLASEVNFGVWKIRAEVDGEHSSRDVRVENYVLPRYDVIAQLPRTWVLPDEPVTGAVEARYFFGKDVAGEATVTASRHVGEWEVFDTFTGPLENGRLDFSLAPVEFVAGTPGNGGLGTIQLDFEITDSTGHLQKATELLTVSPAATTVQLISQQETIKPGLPARVLVVTESPSGDPKSADVDLQIQSFDLSGSLTGTEERTVQTLDGSFDLQLTPTEETSRIVLEASVEDAGRVARARLEISSTYSPSSNFIALFRQGAPGPAEVGEALTFTARTTAARTIFYEVFARGRTVFSATTSGDSIRFDVTPAMAPSARLVAYVIGDDGEVTADSLDFSVNLPSAFTITTSLPPENLAPGQSLTLAIDTGHPSAVGLSMVDCTVLALGRGRLHLGDVFAELERRFLEPVEEESGPEPGFGGPAPGLIDFEGGFWGGGWNTPGTLEIFEESGLNVVTSDGLSVPGGQFVGGWDDMMFDFDGPFPPEAAAGGGETPSSSGPPPVRVRQFFPETWVWEPELLTDENGLATLELTVPDSITCWELEAFGTSPEGLGVGSSRATVFQEFFVEPSLPVAVTRGEQFPVAIQIYNYLDRPQSVDLELGSGDWYELLGNASLSVEVPASSATVAHFAIRPTRLGSHRVEVVARGSELSDAVIRFLTVEPEGAPVTEVDNRVLEAGQTDTLDTTIPAHAIPDSGESFLMLTPSPIAQTLQGLADLISMPSGCGEQNMIRLAPDVEVLRYLDATGEVMPEIRAMAEHFINVGYQRQLTYQTTDGGFAAFGGEEGSLWLTAFVLSTFSVARDVRDIDEGVLRDAADMLVGRQNPDGSFRTDDFLIHQEMDGGLSNSYAMTAYVTHALADYLREGVDHAAALEALSRAGQYLVEKMDEVSDSYSRSIAAATLTRMAGFEEVATTLVDELIEAAITEGTGLHWEPYPIETTGYVTLALLEQSRPQASGAVEWLSTQRNSLGGYGHSTQDTVVAIRALTQAALKIRADLDLTVEVKRGATTLATFTVDETNYDLLQSTELPVVTSAGGELPVITSSGVGNLGYQVVRRYSVPVDFLPPPRDLRLTVDYDATDIEVDDRIDVNVEVVYTGEKDRTAMSLVEVGVPTGFEVVRTTLDALVESGPASRVETAARRAIIYLDGLTRDEPVRFGFQLRARFPVRADGALSRAYAYYDPEIQASTRGPELIVSEPTTSPTLFVRGDTNLDGTVEMTDAILSLSYQFLEQERPECLDAVDVNDDGLVNITDPIYLLTHIFLGGDRPPAPYPVAGVDPTPDTLECGD